MNEPILDIVSYFDIHLSVKALCYLKIGVIRYNTLNHVQITLETANLITKIDLNRLK